MQTVLTLDTRSIVDAYADVIQLSPINSGATIMSIARRGHYQSVAEVVIPDRVVPILDHVLTVHRIKADEVLEELWWSPRAQPGDGP